MKTYLVEFENLVCNEPILKIFSGNTEDDVWEECAYFASCTDYVGSDFDMYPLYRKPDGSLEMGGVIF